MRFHTPTRDECVVRIAFYHVLAAVAADRRGPNNVYDWSGTPREGRYFTSSGNSSWAAAWNDRALVAVAQGREGPKSAPLFVGAPPSIVALGSDLAARFTATCRDQPSSSFWVESEGAGQQGGLDRHQHRLAVLLTERREAFLGLGAGEVTLGEYFGLEEAALWFAEELSSAVMTSTPVRIRRGTEGNPMTAEPGSPGYAESARLLAQLGVAIES